jgi:hypothetical protein
LVGLEAVAVARLHVFLVLCRFSAAAAAPAEQAHDLVLEDKDGQDTQPQLRMRKKGNSASSSSS